VWEAGWNTRVKALLTARDCGRHPRGTGEPDGESHLSIVEHRLTSRTCLPAGEGVFALSLNFSIWRIVDAEKQALALWIFVLSLMPTSLAAETAIHSKATLCKKAVSSTRVYPYRQHPVTRLLVCPKVANSADGTNGLLCLNTSSFIPVYENVL
jgi:hypothetical protein